MPIALIQISDIHFHETSDRIASRATAVGSAVLAKIPQPEAIFILLTGDIANSGAKAEYKVAEGFVERLKKSLHDQGIMSVEVVAIPGNHDLDLRVPSDIRQFILENLDNYLSKEIDTSGSGFAEVLSPQDNFFEFEAIASGASVIPVQQRLFYQRTFTVGEHSIRFGCFNTAWLSRRQEIQAKLFVPKFALSAETPEAVDLSIALFHHPSNWLYADNAKEVSRFIERNFDVVLTGHEHDPDLVRSLKMSGESIDFLRAPAFSDSQVDFNGFQCLTIDFEASLQTVSTFGWNGTRFTEADTGLFKLLRNSGRPSSPFEIRDEFLIEVRDIGTGFRHPRCVPPQCVLRLRDLYIYPDMTWVKIEKILSKSGAKNDAVNGANFVEFLHRHHKVVIFGQSDSGKTSFAKILFEDLLKRGFLPLLVSGTDLRNVRDDAKLVETLSRACVRQFAMNSGEPFFQAEPLLRVLIIDDFEKCKMSTDGRRQLMNLIGKRFGTVLVLASEIVRIQDMTEARESEPFYGFEQCLMKQFGRFHRQSLIRAWLRLGREGWSEIDEDIERQVATTDKTVQTLLGKNVLPHFPVTILTILQLMETKEAANTANGSYGYLYEALLKLTLAEIGPQDVDEKITYISGIGYTMFSSSRPVMTEEELREEHQRYSATFDMVRDFSKVTSDLLRAEVLVESNKTYRFKYQYIYYYSVAKYFQDHIPELRQRLNEIAAHVYGEANANVLIFYVYLTKDQELIKRLVSDAKRIYSNIKPCDLDKDVDFLNRLAKEQPAPLVLECGDPGARRDEYNRRQDEAAAENPPLVLEDSEIGYDEAATDIIKITIAFKTLEILGQVLRNFTGSLPGPLKLDITQECYALGLRTLHAVLMIASSGIDSMRQYFGSLISERSGITDPKELANRTDDYIVWIGQALATVTVKRVSYAVGHENLTNTYQRIVEGSKELSVRIIDAAIKLDHFERVPEKELTSLASLVRKNPCAYSVIRELVAEFLYFYNLDFPKMQSLGSQWHIAVQKPKYLSNRSKK
jgi:predicted MPP superfamily phosphohydrolase